MAAAKGYRVSGPVAVIRTLDGSERYLYRGATFKSEEFDSDSIKHLVAVGLLEETTGSGKAEEPAAEELYKGSTVDDLKAEIGRRNEGREDADKVSADGKKDDLVAALVADDAKQAE